LKSLELRLQAKRVSIKGKIFSIWIAIWAPPLTYMQHAEAYWQRGTIVPLFTFKERLKRIGTSAIHVKSPESGDLTMANRDARALLYSLIGCGSS
jgi:hypothetical protein